MISKILKMFSNFQIFLIMWHKPKTCYLTTVWFLFKSFEGTGGRRRDFAKTTRNERNNSFQCQSEFVESRLACYCAVFHLQLRTFRNNIYTREIQTSNYLNICLKIEFLCYERYIIYHESHERCDKEVKRKHFMRTSNIKFVTKLRS